MFEYPEVAYCISRTVFIVCECYVDCVVAVRSGYNQLGNATVDISSTGEFSVNID